MPMRDQGGINKGEGNSDWKKPYADSPASLWPQRGDGHVHVDWIKSYVLVGVRVAGGWPSGGDRGLLGRGTASCHQRFCVSSIDSLKLKHCRSIRNQ